jgi:phage/plasmid primase-like uncharacterized protein
MVVATERRINSAHKVNEARAVPIRDALGRRGIQLRRVGRELVGPCPVCGGSDRFAANLAKGVWNCRHCQRGGDVISLLQRLDGCTFAEAVERLTGDARPSARQPVARVVTEKQAENRTDDDEAARIRSALRIWRAAHDPRGTVVVRYLASRGLTLPNDIANDAIRYHEALNFNGASVGGMVALFRDIGTNEPCGIHRTFLDGAGRKLERRMLGHARGAAIKLDGDKNVTLGLHIGEGIETCLAAWLAGFRPVWALGSAGGIADFPVLSGIEAITVLGEVGDGGVNHRAAQACAQRWIEAGRDAFIVTPQVGGDLNDLWREVTP